MPEQFKIGKWFLAKRPNSPHWCICWFDPATRQTRRASLCTADFQVAKFQLAEHVTKHGALDNADPAGVPLEAILIRYWKEHGSDIPSAEQARHALAKWSDHFSGATVSELTPQRQEMFIAALRTKGYQPSYISRILSVGRAALKRAWKRGELTSVPFIADVKRDLEHEAERFRELDVEEVVRLLAAAARVPHLLTFCMISLNTLARPDAVLDLGPAQVDLKRRLIKLNPDGRKQTKKYRPVVPISETLLPWLQQSDGSHYVLHNGKPVASIKKSFAKAAGDAGVKDVSPYCLRHTMGTELRARGVPEWEAKGLMGHKSEAARTTERYARFRPDHLGQAVRAIDAYFTDLRAASGALSDSIFNPVRASSVLVPKLGFPQSLGNMVGATGIEPVTPAMSTQCSYR
jgi:integrase